MSSASSSMDLEDAPSAISLEDGPAIVSVLGQKRKYEGDDGVLPGTSKKPRLSDAFTEHVEEQVWPRPEVSLNPASDDLVFMLGEVDYTVSNTPVAESATVTGPVPFLRVFGCTNEGNSVLLKVHGYLPYLWVPAPPGFAPEHCSVFTTALNHAIRTNSGNAGALAENVLEVVIVQKQSIMGYTESGDLPFLRITLVIPKLVPTARRVLEDGKVFASGGGYSFNGHCFQTYESDVPFALRWMVDSGVPGAGWLRVPAGRYRTMEPYRGVERRDVASRAGAGIRVGHNGRRGGGGSSSSSSNGYGGSSSSSSSSSSAGSRPKGDARQSKCQIEAICNFQDIVSLGAQDEWSDLAPVRVLSFDIECITREGVFPEPERDAVIQIANIVKVHGSEEAIVRNVFVLGGCSHIGGTEVVTFERECDMLDAWGDFVQIVDPDILTGYNVNNFDYWYLVTRANRIGAKRLLDLGRMLGEETRIKDTTFSSKAFGRRDSREATLAGRVTIDMLQVMQRDHKLRSYSLNSVSAHFLGQQKEDVHYSMITTLHEGTDDDRRRLAVYCVKDAYLPLQLMDTLQVLVNYMEMARVTGIPPSYVLSRGQQIKVVSQLYRKAIAKNLLIPTTRKDARAAAGNDVNYVGAIVIDPKTGFYDKPIATLDFSSLYPSIMMAHNLCYSTLLDPRDVRCMQPDQYVRTPEGACFVKATVKKGILPEILEELLAARKVAKRQMAIETDPMKKSVQNGRQLALKVSANSVYGFTGATVGKLPCLFISSGVTGFGREMIAQTRKLVEERYTIANGYSHDAEVIYGDTDSVMVRFGVDTVAEAMELGKEAAEYVTTHFVRPINLEFEKVYFPYLLMAKKRYAGLFWTRPDRHDKLDAKGIVTVRRDNCPLVPFVIDTCLQKILIDRDVHAAEEFAKGVISDLLQNKLDLSLLVISKALSKTEYAAKQAHVELAERMRKRDPGSAPKLGDRVPFVIVKALKGSKAYEKSEDPLFALEHNIPLDTQYYLDHQLKNPLLAIFEPILRNPESLFHGAHTRTIMVQAPTSSGISAFTVRSHRCLGCNCALPPFSGDDALCASCLPREGEVFRTKIEGVKRLERQFNRAWTQCQTCQGQLHQPVLCQSRDCPIFYMRKKVQIDLKKAQKELERFNLGDEDDNDVLDW